MNIVVCVKFTPDIKDMEIRDDGSVSLDRAEWTISEYDLNAVEAGVKLCEEVGGKVTALSAGSSAIDSSKLKKDLLSRGPDELVLIIEDSLGSANAALTSTVLAAAVRKIGQVDLVLCGEGSADHYDQQVGLQVGERLEWPTTNSVKEIQASNDGVRVVRDLEEEIELLDVPLPAVLSVTTDINVPRLPTMKEVLKANRKLVTLWRIPDIGLELQTDNTITSISTRAPERPQRKKKIISGNPEDAVKEMVASLESEGAI